MIQKYYLFLIITQVLATAFLQPAKAEGRTPEYIATATDRSVRLSKGQVEVSFMLDLGERIVYANHQRRVTPVLVSADGTRQAELPAVVANGRNRAIKLQKEPQNNDKEAYVTLRGNKEENRHVSYRAAIAYEPWMDNARLSLREEVTGCNCGDVLQAEQTLKEQALYQPQLRPSAEAECPRTFTPRSRQCDAFLIYPVDQTRLYPNRYGNAAELAKIDSALHFVRQNPDYVIRRIYISGYASPEGSLKHNRRLAEGRAEALRQYVTRQYDVADTLLEVTAGEENWHDLQEAVRRMELPYKNELLDIIAATNVDPDQREARLRAVGGGQPYSILLRTVYPGLRKNTFRIQYISRERTPEEARRLSEKAPGELNAYEFYTVARTYHADDPQAYGNLLLRAADTYPDNTTANLNAARVCLLRGDTERAARYLQHTADEPAAWNNRGLLLWQQGNQREALYWFRKAADAGNTQAQENLKEIEKRGI